MKEQKNIRDYYIGLDIGTDSVGYAVTDEAYHLCKYKGEPMWGVTIFEEAQLGQERRAFRTARRRLDRRQQRVSLIRELFAPYIATSDPDFFLRLQNSSIVCDDLEEKIRIFANVEETKNYHKKYPTIHHLLCDLMKGNVSHDARLLYLACAWLVAHRGHFLSEVDKEHVSDVLEFHSVYNRFCSFFKQDENQLPWDEYGKEAEIEKVLKKQIGITQKVKELSMVLFGVSKPPKKAENERYSWEGISKLLCGGKYSLKELFGNDAYAELGSISLDQDDDTLAQIFAELDEDAELLITLKGVYDWSLLVDVLHGKTTVSEAKVTIYEQHRSDLKTLKRFVRKYLPQKYSEVFRSVKISNNYVAYSYHYKGEKLSDKVKKADKADFCDYVKKLFKDVVPETEDQSVFGDMMARLDTRQFLPKQRDGDNRVIPYQLYWHELKVILDQASESFPFLDDTDVDGIKICDKILSVFEFRIPYYVGPLRTDQGNNAWMVRKSQGKIYPWNFEERVDLDASEQEFIRRMTNTCTYLPGEPVLPKNSFCYCAFNVLNEINNLKVNGIDISVQAKQALYMDLFMKHTRVTPKAIRDYLISNNEMGKEDKLSGIDETVKSTLKPYHLFGRLLDGKVLNQSDVEKIIERITFSEEKYRLIPWLKKEFPQISEPDQKYIASLKLKDFGRLSKAFLCNLQGTEKATGEVRSILQTMWETNCNLNQILSDHFTYAEQIQQITAEYYQDHPMTLNDRLNEMYISNAVKHPIIRTLDILKDVIKVQGCAPKMIFVEMARGNKEDEKGKRTVSRLQQIRDRYAGIDEEVRDLNQQLDAMGEMAENRLQSDKLFLYYMQLGKCLYTGTPIDLKSVIDGDGTYNIEHIYPRSFVKDDSIVNNKILVDSKVNGEKSDRYPIHPAIQAQMADYWKHLHEIGLLSDEKYKRLTRKTGFTDEEKYEFINRQLVETRQSTKAVTTLLKEEYPDTEIVYVKAGLVSDFRQQFHLLKSRQINDLHHAKDAYLNIVAGNVYHSYFNKNYFRLENGYNMKPEMMFTHTVKCGARGVWNGGSSVAFVENVVRKNTAHFTRYAFCRKGGFFDQMPVRAAKGLVPLKKGKATELYGGYNKSTATFFVLVRYKIAKKQDIMVMPVELLYSEAFMKDDAFAETYAKEAIGNILNKPVESVEILLDKRILKINTMLSLDGLRVCITGKSSGGRVIGIMIMSTFMTNRETENYIKKLESFANKKAKKPKIVADEKYDGITKEKNNDLYDLYIQKFGMWPYCKRPANPVEKLNKVKDQFIKLDVTKQVYVLLQIQGLFGRANKADLREIGDSENVGVAALSSSLSNWKKNYTDVRIIDSSASGLFESVSGNLLDLL